MSNAILAVNVLEDKLGSAPGGHALDEGEARMPHGRRHRLARSALAVARQDSAKRVVSAQARWRGELVCDTFAEL